MEEENNEEETSNTQAILGFRRFRGSGRKENNKNETKSERKRDVTWSPNHRPPRCDPRYLYQRNQAEYEKKRKFFIYCLVSLI